MPAKARTGHPVDFALFGLKMGFFLVKGVTAKIGILFTFRSIFFCSVFIRV